jgi:hypothetical protein
LKHQTVDIAHGIAIDMHEPMSLRRNDLTLLRESKIVDRLQAIQLGDENQYVLFGDSAYKKQSHLTSYFKDDTQIEDHVEWNKRLKHVRISIEWNYGGTAALYKYIAHKEKLRSLASKTVAKVYTVATLLRNCHVMLYGCQSSNFFDLRMHDNMLSAYLTGANL